MIQASYYVFKTDDGEYLKPIHPVKDSESEQISGKSSCLLG